MFDFHQFTILFVSAILFVIIDSIYLNLVSNYFNNQIKLVQGTPIKINLFATFLCYIFLIFGINYFIIRPKRSVHKHFY